jgi:adenosylhomocysteine nucleosidase
VPLVTGVGRAAAGRVAEVACRLPARLVIAAGFCGGLDGRLAVGDVIAPIEVCDEAGGRWACHPLPGLTQAGRLLTASRIIGEPTEKRDIGRRFAADAVDMETAAVAEVCAARGVPFAAVRAVSDAAGTALSPRLAGLLAGGRVSPWKAAGAVLRQPSLLAEFRRLARDTRAAAANLAATLVGLVSLPPPG